MPATSPTPAIERVVHAQNTDGSVIVRLDRAGKWYHEPAQGKRQNLTVKSAAALALTSGWTVNDGLYGGKLFHATLSKMQG